MTVTLHTNPNPYRDNVTAGLTAPSLQSFTTTSQGSTERDEVLDRLADAWIDYRVSSRLRLDWEATNG